ncbi:UNVERIFIED_ORG: hypothetical protein M2438_002792 [Methylobacterium sp. SuP10 SLI 274]|uniref:hypothetical protein n=1 Tax=Methylorubrum extorquens TaxID=408 RepID=UPI00209FAF1D|nr:hypothetical protein [Methylorubrum extorquens]MDF9864024.1 hypothetical protein [Methylorubrum pseudosasae]MDH6637617.1 hypothetical protein [Methylobacterium sp. SuP10 SLI 274]MDH6666797.1 hypothetical protein [Methylorubrum zatmanii]MCP1558703.1 hypothetical protein [Methylorubrum extorquens]MDF9792335.1 hypothetical protein [Methylorubrum extorquens]
MRTIVEITNDSAAAVFDGGKDLTDLLTLARVKGIDAAEGAETDARCLIPGFDGADFSRDWKEALWARFTTQAP